HFTRPLHCFPTRRSSDLHAEEEETFHRPPADAPEGKQRLHHLFIAAPTQPFQIQPALGDYPGKIDDVLRFPTVELKPGQIVIGKDRKSTRLNSSHVKISY